MRVRCCGCLVYVGREQETRHWKQALPGRRGILHQEQADGRRAFPFGSDEQSTISQLQQAIVGQRHKDLGAHRSVDVDFEVHGVELRRMHQPRSHGNSGRSAGDDQGGTRQKGIALAVRGF